MFALSTCWNSHRHEDGEAMLEEIAALGFERVELGHGTKLSLVEGILRACARKIVKIDSVHNFCPLPAGVREAAPNYHVFSSSDRGERLSAVRQTRQTIDFAKRVGARAVVIHLGHVPMRDYTDRLVRLHKQGRKDSKEYAALKVKAVCERQARIKPYWDWMIETLTPVVEHAAAQDILLGVETRYLYEEIPAESELKGLFQQFDGSPLRYWHDTGHAASKAFLGFIDYQDLLRDMNPYRAGWHIHDVISPAHDHQVPGKGDVDFRMIAPYLLRDAVRVIELSPRVRPEDVRKGHEFLRQLLTTA